MVNCLLFTLYKDYWPSTNYSQTLIRDVTDSYGIRHKTYQQYFYNIPVEAAEYAEHGDSGYVDFANGYVANLTTVPNQAWNETDARDVALDTLSHLNFAWDDLSYESELQDSLGDPSATYYPAGEVVWALAYNGRAIGPIFLEKNYQLCWAFEIFSVNPERTTRCYVNAEDGTVFKIIDLSDSDGPATTTNYGSKTIDTSPAGSEFKLRSNNGSYDIHTKYYGSGSFSIQPNIKDDDDNWGTDHQSATSAHFVVTQAWKFFDEFLGWTGANGNGKKVKVWVDSPLSTLAAVGGNENNPEIMFSGTEDGTCIDVAGHEYLHLAAHYWGWSGTISGEQRAYIEGMSDVFGFLTERWYIDSTSNCNGGSSDCDWTLGEDCSLKYDMKSPSDSGYSQNVGDLNWNDSIETLFEAYQNSSLIAHHFWMLSQGGVHTNPVTNQTYWIQAMDIDDIARVHWYVYRFLAPSTMQIDNLPALMNQAATLILQNPVTFNTACNCAWATIGTLNGTECATLSINDTYREPKITIFPNPSSGLYNINSNFEIEEIEVLDLKGSVVFSRDKIGKSTFQIELGNRIQAGVYVINIYGRKEKSTSKLIKLH